MATLSASRIDEIWQRYMAWKAFHESEKPALDRDPFAVTKHALRAALVFVDNELDKAGLYLAKVSSLTIAKMDFFLAPTFDSSASKIWWTFTRRNII